MKDQAVNTAPVNATGDQQFRSQVGHISRQSGVFFAGTIFTAALGYLFKVYLARVLGAELLGVYALGITLVGFVGVFNSLGLVESAVRFAAVYRAGDKPQQLRALLWWGGVILLGVNVLFAAIFLKMGSAVAWRFYHSCTLALYIPWFATLMVLGAISTFYGRILAGYKAVGTRTLISSFVGSPATMLLAVLLVSLGGGLRGYLLAQVLGAVLVIVILLVVVWKSTPPEARFPLPWPAPLEPEVWSFSAAAVGVLLLEFLMSQVDKVALGFYVGTRSVGIYSVAAAMVAYVTLILNSVNQIFSPVIADLHARGDRAMLRRLYKALTKWMLGLTLPLAITVMVCARPIMRIFGHDFEAGWPILVIGTAGQLVNCGVGSVGLLLLMSGNQRRLLRAQAGMAAVMIVASVALVPVWGIVGAAVAAAITNAGTNIWNLLSVRKVFDFSPFSPGFARLLPPAFGAVVAALALRHCASILGQDLLVIVASLLGTYGTFAGATAAVGLDSDDRLIVSAIWSKIWRSDAGSKGMAS
jgi:O-antigen/teichoic acid export membrane protein